MTVEQKPDNLTDVDNPLQEISAFIESNPDPRELKRAVAVRMVLEGFKPIKIRLICLCFKSIHWQVESALYF